MTTHEIKLHNLNWVLLREDLDLEILHWGPPLEVVWGPPLEGQNAAKCHAWCKVPRAAQSATIAEY
ncbi:hypothetical protein CUMW_258360, partial [Citrus unshiu]